ncbi:MAG: flavin monoamine oxidase family protein [Myxococcales bacterium]|nr:flavin monoamine oxidase family protein [Myxococcales bacterium]
MGGAMEVDCVVVGAGFAGLRAADVLAEHGRKVAVLEARGRVGGRVETVRAADGTALDLGGQWLGPSQDRMYALCRRFGGEVYPMHVAGHNLLVLGGRTRRYRGLVPLRAPLTTLANIGWVFWRLEWLAQRVPLAAPWDAPRARALDQQTVGDWIRRNVPDRAARAMVHVGIESVFAADPDEISLLHALFYMRSGGSFDKLTRSEGGAQQDRVRGGLGPIAEALAADVRARGGRIALEFPVRILLQSDLGVRAEGEAGAVTARRAIVAVPPPLAAAIEYVPGPAPERRALWDRLPMGSVVKCLALYARPFWREDGCSGQSLCDEGPVHVTFDASPADGRPGVLLGFVEASRARELGRWDPRQRRAAVLACFARAFGPAAAQPVEYVERVWSAEPRSGGCYAAVPGPGTLTTYGQLLRRPEGRIHWAGTETATVWNGYVEGAVRSGERAAAEVLAADV